MYKRQTINEIYDICAVRVIVDTVADCYNVLGYVHDLYKPIPGRFKMCIRDSPRSTVGTVTEIYDYMRLLWARIGTPHCPKCGKEIHQQTIDQIIDRLMALEEKTRVQDVYKRQELQMPDNPHMGHRQRMLDKFRRFGLEIFSDHEVLEMLLYFAVRQGDTNPTAVSYTHLDVYKRQGGVRAV